MNILCKNQKNKKKKIDAPFHLANRPCYILEEIPFIQLVVKHRAVNEKVINSVEKFLMRTLRVIRLDVIVPSLCTFSDEMLFGGATRPRRAC